MEKRVALFALSCFSMPCIHATTFVPKAPQNMEVP